jgi:hypothetical protein
MEEESKMGGNYKKMLLEINFQAAFLLLKLKNRSKEQ